VVCLTLLLVRVFGLVALGHGVFSNPEVDVRCRRAATGVYTARAARIRPWRWHARRANPHHPLVRGAPCVASVHLSPLAAPRQAASACA
jgi:hypothetical protein